VEALKVVLIFYQKGGSSGNMTSCFSVWLIYKEADIRKEPGFTDRRCVRTPEFNQTDTTKHFAPKKAGIKLKEKCRAPRQKTSVNAPQCQTVTARLS